MSREITVSNLSGSAVGVVGDVINPGHSKSLGLHLVQGNDDYVSELVTLKNASKISVTLEGDPLTATQIANLNAPLSAELGIIREVFTNVPIADVDAFKTAFAAPSSNTTYSGTALNGAVGTGSLTYPRNFTIKGTTGGGEALIEKNIIVTGYDVNGALRSETITATALGASDTATYSGAIAFSSIVSVYVPLDNSGSKGDYEFGFGPIIGLGSPLSQGGLIAEFMDNSALTTGTIVLSGTSAPNGTYSPATAPDNSHDYIVIYYPN